MFLAIHPEIYPYPIMVSFNQSDKEFYKSLKTNGILIKKEDRYNYDMSDYEVLHATIQILKWSGLKLSDDSEEAYTYLQGFITEKILTKIKELFG